MLTRIQHKAAELQASAAALDKAFIRLFSQLRWTADAVAKARGLLRVIAEASAAEVLTDICAVYHHATTPLRRSCQPTTELFHFGVVARTGQI